MSARTAVNNDRNSQKERSTTGHIAAAMDAPERSEEHDDWDVLLDVRHSGLHHLPRGPALVRAPKHLDQKRRRRAVRVLEDRPDLADKEVLWIFLFKDVDGVGCHLLLRDDHLLGPIDDEVAPRVVRALVQILQVGIPKLVQLIPGRKGEDRGRKVQTGISQDV
jgi:hypothetical protein